MNAITAIPDTSFEDLPEDVGAIAQMGSEGDIKYTWDPKNPDEVEAARRHFEDLKSQGFLLFKMKRWRRKEPMETFDPKAGRLMAVAPEPEEDDVDGEVAEDFEPGERYVAVPAMQGG